ncbi:VOC family protein [soil metagenome]
MTVTLAALCIDAHDPPALARFWAGLLGWGLDGAADVVPDDDTGFRLRFVANPAPKTGPNQMHVDLTSTSLDDQAARIARALELGGSHLDVGQTPDEGHVVLADPEGNELCVVEPTNNFLAGCGLVGALSSDGTQAVGYFWSAALGWPLIWDQDEETAIRASRGGPIISWGGPPVREKVGRNRWRWELAASDGLDDEVARLVSLGAVGSGDELLDPDGNEFSIVADA